MRESLNASNEPEYSLGWSEKVGQPSDCPCTFFSPRVLIYALVGSRVSMKERREGKHPFE